MISREQQVIENSAAEVLINLDAYRLPVDPASIARQEGILLAPGFYGGCFDGRIEYRPLIKTFLIYYAQDGPGGP